MNKSLLIAILLLTVYTKANAQKVYKWEKEHPGVLIKPKTKPPAGYNTDGIFTVFNKIPMLHTPKGYDVRQGVSVRLSGKVYKGMLMIGLPMYYSWDNGPVQRQGEYYQSHIYINDRELLRDEYSHVLSEVTDKLQLPTIYTDTFPIHYKTINGYEVGMALDRVNKQLYILNPKRRACFLPVTKEQFVKIWLKKLDMDIEKEKTYQVELKEDVSRMKDNAEVLKNLEEGMVLSKLQLDFLLEKKKSYEHKLASFSEAEKKAQAFAASPKKMAVLQVKGKTVDKVTGDMSFELADGIEARETHPLFIFNPDFFDPQLPKTAFQLMIIRDGFRQNWKESQLMPLVEESLFPLIDFKQLASLMNK
jgi:hypothetical protein